MLKLEFYCKTRFCLFQNSFFRHFYANLFDKNFFVMFAGCGLDHPDVVADQQRAGAGLRLRLGPRRRGVLPEGLRSRHQGQGLHAQQVG